MFFQMSISSYKGRRATLASDSKVIFVKPEGFKTQASIETSCSSLFVFIRLGISVKFAAQKAQTMEMLTFRKSKRKAIVAKIANINIKG